MVFGINYIAYPVVCADCKFSMSYSVAKNATFLTVASVLQRAISFAYFIFIARTIGVENTGQYFFAIAFTAVFTVVADFGLNSVLVREAARSDEKFTDYASTVFWSKIILGIVAYGLIILMANVLNYPASLKNLIYLSGVTVFLDNLHSFFYSLFRARKNLLFEAAGIIGTQFLTLVVGSVALLTHLPLYWLILAYTIPSACNVLYISCAARWKLGVKIRWQWDKKIGQWLFAIAVPFAIAGIINRLYSYSDSILMSKLLAAKDLGLWSVPYKITFAFQFIPAALTASVYPAMSTMFVAEKDQIGILFAKAWRYLFLVVMPISIGLSVVAVPVITKLYGAAYLPSVSVLRVLLVGLVFSFLTFVNGATLNAINRQKTQTLLLALSLFISVTMNWFLLPVFGIWGAAITALTSNVFLFTAGLLAVCRDVKISGRVILSFVWRILVSAGVMGIFAFLLLQKISFVFVIPLAGAMYVGLLFVTGALTKNIIVSLIKKNKTA